MMETRKDNLVLTFILVHGTFAGKAPWATRGSPLRGRIVEASEAAGVRINFIRLIWSGKNLHSARRRASDRITRLIERSEDNRRFILVGHSHGGSAIAYFANRKAELPSKVVGCIFLSTPFVALKARREAVKIALAAYVVLMIGIQTIADMFDMSNSFASNLLKGLVAIPLLGVKSVDHIALQKRISEEQTAEIPKGNYLFLRSSGDEAAAALAFAQFATWICSKLLAVFLFPVARLVPQKKRSFFPFGVFRFLAMIVAVHFAMLCATHVLWATQHTWTILRIFSPFQQVLEVVLLIGMWLFSLLFLFGFCALSVTLLWVTIQAAASRAFGWTSFLDGVLLDMSVEPVPFGSHELVHVPWIGQGSTELKHSWSYENDFALDSIQKWVTTTLMTSCSPSK